MPRRDRNLRITAPNFTSQSDHTQRMVAAEAGAISAFELGQMTDETNDGIARRGNVQEVLLNKPLQRPLVYREDARCGRDLE